MAIVTKNPHMWFVVENSSGEKQTLLCEQKFEKNYPFSFTAPFSDTPSPQDNTVTIYNMSKEHDAFYKKKQKALLYFNWGSSKKLIAEGFISKVEPGQSDGVTTSKVITFTEGKDYNNLQARKLRLKKTKKINKYKTVKTNVPGHYKTYKSGKKKWIKATVKKKRIKTRATKTIMVNKTYRKGTSYKKLIQGVASQSGIKIAKIDLAKNPTIKKAYTAKGKPLTLLKQLVTKTGSKMTYIQGNLEIVNPRSKKRSWIVIDDDDLIQQPNPSEDTDKDNVWEIVTPLIPEVTINVGIKMKSRFLKGSFYVKSGEHSFDGDNPQTQMSIIKI